MDPKRWAKTPAESITRQLRKVVLQKAEILEKLCLAMSYTAAEPNKWMKESSVYCLLSLSNIVKV